MNISSAVVLIEPTKMQEVLAKIEGIEGCEVHLTEPNRGLAVISIEALSVAREMEILKCVEGLDGVVEANLHYSYSAEELEKARESLSNSYLEELDKSEAESVRYSGSIYHQMQFKDEPNNN